MQSSVVIDQEILTGSKAIKRDPKKDSLEMEENLKPMAASPLKKQQTIIPKRGSVDTDESRYVKGTKKHIQSTMNMDD